MSRRPPRCSALLLFALRREDAWFRRSCWPVPPGTGFAVTGMGPDRAAAWAARALGGGWRVESVLSVGLCGGHAADDNALSRQSPAPVPQELFFPARDLPDARPEALELQLGELVGRVALLRQEAVGAHEESVDAAHARIGL